MALQNYVCLKRSDNCKLEVVSVQNASVFASSLGYKSKNIEKIRPGVSCPAAYNGKKVSVEILYRGTISRMVITVF